jgi:integrase
MATIRKRSWTTSRGEARESWQCDFTDAQGKRRHKQFATKKAADQFMVEARGQVAAGTFTADSTSPTVQQAAELWLAKCERDGLERSSIHVYKSHKKWHIGPKLGKLKLSRLTRPAVEKFADELLAAGRSRKLTNRVLVSLRAIMGEAMRRGLVAQNVATGVRVKISKRHEQKVKIPSREAVRELLAKATGRERALLVTAIFTGMRASEIRALTWADVDFAQKIVRVRQRATTSGVIGSLKSATSSRDKPMPPTLISTLREWQLASGGRDGLVFPGRHGPLAHNTILCTIGRAHRFRHFYCAWLIAQNMNIKRIQTLMGHSSIRVTLDTYGHLLPQEDDHDKLAAAERELIGG